MGQHQSLASDEGTELSLRVAINKLIESCLSNPPNPTDDMSGSQESNKNDHDLDNKPTSAVEPSDEDQEEKPDVDGKSEPKPDSNKSMVKAQSFSSLLEMHIRDMIVNCENGDEPENNNQDQKSADSVAAASLPPSVSSSSSSSTSSNCAVTCSTVNTVKSSTNETAVSPTKPSARLDFGGITSVPLQTLVDKVLDNSLGVSSMCPRTEKNITSLKNNSSGINEKTEPKVKLGTSYEIAADSAKFVSEKVARCVERNQNTADISLPSKSDKNDMCFMAHIEKALERNFAILSEDKNESSPNSPATKLASQKDSVITSTSTSSTVESLSSRLDQDATGKIIHSSYKPSANIMDSSGNVRQTLITNADGTISVQDIVDRIFSQTEVISKLLAPGVPPVGGPSSVPKSTSVSAPERTPTSHHAFERNIVKTFNSSHLEVNNSTKMDPRSPIQSSYVKQGSHLADQYKSSKQYHSTSSREDYIKSLSPRSSEKLDKHLPYNTVTHKDNTYHRKSNQHLPHEVNESQFLDPRLISETQRQTQNLMMLSRYPYQVPMTPAIDPGSMTSANSLLRYCPPSTVVQQQRFPPPLLRIDTVPETIVPCIPHPYIQKAHNEEIKRSPKHPSQNLLVPSNMLLSPGSSPQYQSRLSPNIRDVKHGGSPQISSPSQPQLQRYNYHPSAFTRVKDIAAIERDRTNKLYQEDQLSFQKRSRIENGCLDHVYRERRPHPHPESNHHLVVDPHTSFNKNKVQTPSHHTHPQHLLRETKNPRLDLAYDYKSAAHVHSAADQPLDLSKKTPTKYPHTASDSSHSLPSPRSDYESHNRTPTFSSMHPHYTEQKVNMCGKRVAPEIHHYSSEKEAQRYHDHYRQHQAPVTTLHYSHKSEVSKGNETSAAMTPGMMPEQLGSPGGIRPQLHPLPSPTLSTTYSNSLASQSPHVVNHTPSPIRRSPDMERGGESNISRPSSQCSTSPLDSDKDRRGSVSRHEPVQNIIGQHPPNDILYLICRLCRQTYGSPYGFRKHFRNQHGFEPRAEHTIVHTISATKSALQHIPGMPNSPSSFQQVPDGTLYDSIDIPKIRERASSESKITNPIVVSEDKPNRPTGSKSAESSQQVSIKVETDDTKCLQCEQCKQTFQLNDFGSYKRHCRQHNHTRIARPFQCQICATSFQEPQQLEEHVLNHERESTICKYCKIPYANNIYLEDHMRTVHGTEPSNRSNFCKYCQLSFLDYKELLAHMQTVHNRGIDNTVSSRGIDNTVSSRGIDNTASSRGIDNTVSSVDKDTKIVLSNHVDIQPANQMTIQSCPDSSSDKINSANSESPSSSERKIEADVLPPGEHKLGDRCSSTETPPRSNSNENSQDTVSSVSNSENGEENFYKHKKFFSHRKRKESSETTIIPAKCSKTDDENNSYVTENSADNRVSCSVSNISGENDKQCDSSSNVDPNSVLSENERLCSPDSEGKLQNKQEARHQMPFVWDRITRSQAGKNIKPPDYMA